MLAILRSLPGKIAKRTDHKPGSLVLIFRKIIPIILVSIFTFFGCASSSSLAQSGNQGQGQGQGDGRSVSQSRTIYVLDNTNRQSIFHSILDITRNWDIKYQLIMPNSNSTINSSIVNLAKYEPIIAADIVHMFSENRPKNEIMKALKIKQRMNNNLISYYSSELDRRSRGRAAINAARNISTHQVIASRITELIVALRTIQ